MNLAAFIRGVHALLQAQGVGTEVREAATGPIEDGKVAYADTGDTTNTKPLTVQIEVGVEVADCFYVEVVRHVGEEA